jgi:hypothetical protein
MVPLEGSKRGKQEEKKQRGVIVGSWPLVTDHVYGSVPPVAANCV